MKNLLMLAIAAFFSVQSFAATVTAAQDPWAPFVQKDTGSPGVSVEILTEAMKTQGYEVDFKIMP